MGLFYLIGKWGSDVGTRPEELWTPEEEALLAQRYGRVARRELARMLGRSEAAVDVRVKVLGLASPRSWTYIMLSSVLTYALGFGCQKSVIALMRRELFPVHYVYLGNKKTPAVNIKRMQQWLADPHNWYCLDVSRIRDPRFKVVVRRVRQAWDDEWLTVGQVAPMLGYSQQGINKLIHNGALSAKRHNNWRVLRSEALRVKQVVQAGGGCWHYK